MSHTLLFVPASTWPVLLTVLTLWVFSLPQPHPSCLLWHLFLPNRKPFRQARKGQPWAVHLALPVLTPGLCWHCLACLEGLSPNISSVYKPSSGEGLECWVQSRCPECVTTQHVRPVQGCHTLSKLNVGNLLQRTTTQRENSISTIRTFPRNSTLFAFQKNSKWIQRGFKVCVK